MTEKYRREKLREYIQDALSVNPEGVPVSAPEMANVLAVTEATIRRTLRAMTEDGTIVMAKRGGMKGIPHLYSLPH